MSLGAEYGDEYENYLVQFEMEKEEGKPMSFDDWLQEKDDKAFDDELESGMARSRGDK